MILIIDNYDSFTYNLYQLVGSLGYDVKVYRNDATTPQAIKKIDPGHIIISPGPKTPNESGISCAVIKTFAGKTPILGVCLGHQCIASVYGGDVVHAKRLVHGKTSPIEHSGNGIFKNVENPLNAMRYHSLIVKNETLPKILKPTAHTKDRNELMAFEHAELPVFGVQFHPESFMTPAGKTILQNFLNMKT